MDGILNASRMMGALMHQLSITGENSTGLVPNDSRSLDQSTFIEVDNSFEQQEFALYKVVDLTVLEKVYAMRVIAWRTNMNLPAGVAAWKDSFDDSAQHWAIMTGDVPIAAARITVHNYPDEVPDAEVYNGLIAKVSSPICSFNRLVVHPLYRGLGLSRRLDQVRLAAAKTLGCRSVIITVSDTRRARTIETYGFKCVGDGIPYPDGIIKGRRNIVYVLLL